jgi:hypothetical protein
MGLKLNVTSSSVRDRLQHSQTTTAAHDIRLAPDFDKGRTFATDRFSWQSSIAPT